MPPKTGKGQKKTASTKSAASEKLGSCCICCQLIQSKDDILFCSGRCQQSLHRYCASVSERCFKLLTAENADPFYCFCCYKEQKEEQVNTLLQIVDSLKEEINALKTATAATIPGQPSPSSTNDASQSLKNTGITVNLNSNKSGEPLTSSISHVSRISYPEKKFNVVLYGVNECPSGLSRSARVESDIASVVSVLTTVDCYIQPHSIKECFRLGKFSSNEKRPRPILIRFIRIADVSSILSKRSKLSHPYYIKADMSYEERKQESVLLKERWSLIQAGTDRKDIKIRDNRLLVHKRLYGRVVNQKFVHEDDSSLKSYGCIRNAVDSSPIVEVSLQSDSHVHTPETLVQSTVDNSLNSKLCSLSTSESENPVSMNLSTSSSVPPSPQPNSESNKS